MRIRAISLTNNSKNCCFCFMEYHLRGQGWFFFPVVPVHTHTHTQWHNGTCLLGSGNVLRPSAAHVYLQFSLLPTKTFFLSFFFFFYKIKTKKITSNTDQTDLTWYLLNLASCFSADFVWSALSNAQHHHECGAKESTWGPLLQAEGQWNVTRGQVTCSIRGWKQLRMII